MDKRCTGAQLFKIALCLKAYRLKKPNFYNNVRLHCNNQSTLILHGNKLNRWGMSSCLMDKYSKLRNRENILTRYNPTVCLPY